MDDYSSLLERTRVPQPSLQRFAVIQIFDKLRSAPAHLNPNSDAGREAIAQCFHSLSSASVVDQSVRELCLLVKDSKFDLDSALVQLQSALEASHPRFVNVFVQGIGFLVRLGFRHSPSLGAHAHASENHPFIKVLVSRSEAENDLVQQVLLFVLHCKQHGIGQVCDFLRPLVTFSILRVSSSDSSSSSFLRFLISSLTSLCCSSLYEASPLFDMLINCLGFFHYQHKEDFRNFVTFAECLVDAYIVVLRHLVKIGLMVHEAQLRGVKLLDTLLTVCTDFEKHSIGSKALLQLSRRLLCVQKELGLHYVPELLSPMLSLFRILTLLELEDEGLFVLDLLTFFLIWLTEDGNAMNGAACGQSEMLLFLLPIINLMSLPSKTFKRAASQFLFLLEKHFMHHLTKLRDKSCVQIESSSISKPEVIIFRLLEHLWYEDSSSSSFFLNVYSATGSDNIMECGSKSWMLKLKGYAFWMAQKRKSCISISPSQEVMSAELPMLLSALVCALVAHHSLGSFAVETLGSLSIMEPKLGVTLLLVILCYSNLLRGDINYCGDILLRVLEVLPSLASHSAMLPLIIQTMTPMLHKDSNQVLYGSALRLLCKAWEMNDRIFECLYGLLLPKCFSEFGSNRTIAISMAASLRDICRRSPDRGVELILSVAVCIECRDSVIKALGLQCLGFLCEADAVDFYTAWDVIARHVKEYSTDPIVAYGLCLLLRWGAMDADVYIEASSSVLQILWDIGSSNCFIINPLWKKARIMALKAINCYEVLQIESCIHDFKQKVMDMLINEANGDILKAIGELEVRILVYEHSTRRRLVKEMRSPRTKIEKLLDAFPRVVFCSGKSCDARELPGAALFCLPFNPKGAYNQGKSKNARDVFGEYHTMMKEIAASLHLSRNTLLALLSLQSWKIFMQNWMKDYISLLDVKASSNVLDKTSKAAHDILKSMIQVAEDSIPSVADNIGLAIGAFCMVLPASVHSIKVTASKFLLNWLFKYEHEHSQWSAAISLGVISSCLHLTDRAQKLQIVNGLVEVACSSKSCFIKGACAVGLGNSCQDLLTRVVAAENASDQGSFTLHEKDLLKKIIRMLSSTICQVTEITSNILECLSHYTPPGIDYNEMDMMSELMMKSFYDVGEDLWGVAGLVLGLGSSVSALFRAGSYDAMCHVKILCTSWIAQADSLVSDASIGSQNLHMLGIGACLVLPTVASFCRKVEMMDDSEMNDLLCSYENLISKLLLVKTSNIFHQNLLMASCVGVGSLLAWILDEGLFSLDVQRIKNILELFKRTYSNTYPHLVHLGGWLGVVNAMGADAGSVVHRYSSTIIPQAVYDKKESSRVNGPLLSSSSFEKILLEVTRDLFLVAQNSEDSQLQAFASWALSFLRNHMGLHEHQCINESYSNEVATPEPVQSFSKDSVVVVLSSWLMDLDQSDHITHVNSVAVALRCLSQAPRLPNLDWGAIIRRCMRYDDHNAGFLPSGLFCPNRTLRVECLLFTLAHANKFESLLASLDELTDLSRLKTLDLIMQSCLLFHLPDLLRVFSSSRAQKLFEDINEYLSSPISSFQKYDAKQKTFLQLSCWKGLCKCVNEPFLGSSQYLSCMENCMKVLFGLLPALPIAATSKQEKMSSLEWIESISCLGKARQAWLLDLLQISEMDLVQRDDKFDAVVKKIVAVARLVKLGFLPMAELAKLRSYLLNSKSHGIWDVLVEVVAVLQANEESVKKQWLLSVLEISSVTKYPYTALQLLGLLSGSWCRFMPFLVLEPQAVLVNLPVTLSSLLSGTNWGVIADMAVSYLWTSTERIYNWVMSCGSDEPPILHPIDPSETEMSKPLMRLMLEACTKLKEYLPLNKQLRLANMVSCLSM